MILESGPNRPAHAIAVCFGRMHLRGDETWKEALGALHLKHMS